MNEETFNAYCETQEALWSILVEDKGYSEINYSHEFINRNFYPCLAMYGNKCGVFIENLNRHGYYGIVRRHPDKSYLRFVFIVDSHREIVDPSTVIPIFKKFDNLRMKA